MGSQAILRTCAGDVTIHRLPVCYNHQTCLTTRRDQDPQTSSIYYTGPKVLFSTTNCWFFLQVITKPGFPWSPDHFQLPNQPPGSGFGLDWDQASSLIGLFPGQPIKRPFLSVAYTDAPPAVCIMLPFANPRIRLRSHGHLVSWLVQA